MPANEYYFVSHWRMPCTPAEAYEIIQDRANLHNWWPSGFLEVEPIVFDDGAAGVKVATQGWLPYVLRFTMRELASDPPGSLVLEARGDLNGRGIWTLAQDGDWTNITYDWRVSAEKPIVKWLSPLLKPLFKSSHDWIMARGEKSMRLELMRRRAASDAVRQAIEPPPGPATVPVLPIAAGAGLVALWLLRPRKKPTKREQLVTLAAGTAASIKSQRKQAERAGRKAMKDLRKEARRTARSANKQLQRQSTRARQQLEAALDRAQQGSNGAAGTASSIWDRTDIDDRVAEGVGAARERLEAAIERASIPERAAAVRERVEQVIDESEVPERIEAVRKAARKRSKRWFGRWHL